MSRGPLLLISLIAVSLVAACTFGAPGGSGTNGDDDAPDGQVGTADDRDGDGRPDAEDNCPDVANADQADADGDTLGDVCDNCPAAANLPVATLGFEQPTQRDHDGDGRGDECDLCPHLAPVGPDADGDADGIGDACDPEPGIANPKPYWNGFYDPPDAMWTARTGALSDWEVARQGNGKVGWRQKMLDGTTRHQLLLAGRRQEHFIQTSIAVDAIDTSQAAVRSATVSYGFEELTSFDAYYSCGVRQNNQNNMSDVVVALQHDEMNTGDINAVSWGGTLIGTTVDVTARATRTGNPAPDQGGSALGCAGTEGAKTRTAVVSSIQRPDGQVGLRTFGMTAWFDYIFVVEPRPR